MEDGDVLNLSSEFSGRDILKDGNKMSGIQNSGEENSEYLKVKDCAYRLLGRKAHSVYELRNKLTKREFPKRLIEKILNELIDSDLLNDKSFAEDYVRSKIYRKADGIKKIIYQLRQRGIDKGIINDIVTSQVDDDVQFENALKLANQKLPAIKTKPLEKVKIISKLNLYLLNKGYHPEIIRKVISRLEL